MENVDDYIRAFPKATQKLLQQIRTTILKAAPDAEETISYRMPAYKLHGSLVYFAGYENHIGFYPTASGIAAFKKDFSEFKWSKGAVQFPLDKPMPLQLVTKITAFRWKENLAKAKVKAKVKAKTKAKPKAKKKT